MLETIIPTKSEISIPQERYSNIGTYIQSAEAFSRNMFRPVFIVDMYKKNFLYISEKFSFLLDYTKSDHLFSSGQQYIPSLAHEEISTLKVIFEKAYDLFLSYPIADRMKLVFSYSFNSHCYGRKRVVRQSLTPLALTDDGDLWLVLCITSLSSSKTSGNYVMRLDTNNEYLLYNPEKGRWYLKEGIYLTSEEKEILLLSSQGYTMKEIATILCKSLDSIKMHKRVLFSKLDVKCITEAVLASLNGNLI